MASVALEFSLPAPIDTVFERLTDPDYLVERSLALGELSADCSVEEDGDAVVITMRREIERKLPAVLARLFSPRQTVELVERWNTSGRVHKGSYRLSVLGQPVTVSATLELKAADTGKSLYTVSHSAKASIPLVGGKVEAFILSQTEAGARAELEHLAKSFAAKSKARR
jgi:hypothetical protein